MAGSDDPHKYAEKTFYATLALTVASIAAAVIYVFFIV